MSEHTSRMAARLLAFAATGAFDIPADLRADLAAMSDQPRHDAPHCHVSRALLILETHDLGEARINEVCAELRRHLSAHGVAAPPLPAQKPRTLLPVSRQTCGSYLRLVKSGA